MAGQSQREQLLEFTGEMQFSTTKFIPSKNELRLLVNADTETIGGVGPRLGTEKKGNTMTSTSTSSTSTSTSTTTTSTTTTSTSTT